LNVNEVHVGAKFFDSTVIGSAEKALDSIGNVLESSTEYAVIGRIPTDLRLASRGIQSTGRNG
jgi:hypothetical protein